MRKAFIFIAMFIPFCGMAQSYCLTDFASSDEAERVNFFYDNDNRLCAFESFDRIDPSDPVDMRDTLYYDSNGDCVKIKYYQFINGIWKYTNYIDYTYDNNHNRLSRVNYTSFDNGATFDRQGQYEYTYDNNRITNYVLYFMGGEFMRGTYTYNAQGQLVELLETQNDLFGGSGWNNDSKSNWQYNELGQCIRADFYYWNYGSWALSRSDEYQYDEAGNTSIKLTYENVGLVDRKTYFYDLETAIEDVIMPIDPEGDYKWETFVNRPAGYSWETADESGVLQYICDYVFNYCEVTTGINDILSDIQELNLYPNPTNGLVKFSKKGIQHVEVLDMSGRTVMQQNQNCNTVDLGNLPSGLYIMKAFDGQHWSFGKIQVK